MTPDTPAILAHANVPPMQRRTAGAAGEFGPILPITLALSTGDPLGSALILTAFVALAVIATRRSRSPKGSRRLRPESA